MKLICITGIDGTGKTTLARKVTAVLRDRGLRATYIYGRTYPVLSRGLMALGRATMLRRQDPWRDYAGYTASKKRRMRRRALAWAYTATILLDYYVQIWAKLLRHIGRPDIVVSDRYIYDTVISDLVVHLDYSPAQAERAIEWGLRLLPRPTLTALIDVPEEVAFARKDDVPHIDYLRERRGWFLQLVTRPEVTLFAGEASPEALAASLLTAMAERGMSCGEMVSR